MKKLEFFAIVLFFTSVNFGQNFDSTFYYNSDGSQNWWYIQKDVISFRCLGGSVYSGGVSSLIVNSSEYLEHCTRKPNLIKYNPGTTESQRLSQINNIMLSGSVESLSIAITKNLATSNDFTQDEFVRTNDLILVNFVDPMISDGDVNDFMERNSLFAFHEPNSALPVASWTYIFRIDPTKWTNSLDACREIFVAEQGVIQMCEPDMNILRPLGCQDVGEMNDFSLSTTPDALWHIRNQGNPINLSSQSGEFDADANICECWDEGYHGSGIRVAVIDMGGYDYTHPDFVGQFLTGWEVLSGTAISHTSSFYNPFDWTGHAMATAGVVAALPNSSQTQTAVGVAYESKIIPILIDANISNALIAIQTAVLEGADIINMSFGANNNAISQSSFYFDVLAANQTGRGGLGCIVVGATGNDELDMRCWPAAETVTFGVGASDPNDFRGSYVQSQPWTWSTGYGSNYLFPLFSDGNIPRYNVVAPGTSIMTAWTQDYFGTQTYSYGTWTGTSVATPIVSGIAAMILEKNPLLTHDQVKLVIQSTTDLIRPLSYNYSGFPYIPGYSQEVFFGRVNCFNAISSVVVGIENSCDEVAKIDLATLSSDEYLLLFGQTSNRSGAQIRLFDLSGRLILETTVSSGENTYLIQLSDFQHGIYLIDVVLFESGFHQSFKISK